MVGSIPEWSSRDPFLTAFLGLWIVCFIVSGIGVTLIVAARRASRRPL
jgi:hypothetical protein